MGLYLMGAALCFFNINTNYNLRVHIYGIAAFNVKIRLSSQNYTCQRSSDKSHGLQ